MRAGGDAGDDLNRCLTVLTTTDGGERTLVMRASDEAERDVWLRAVGRCLQKLKAAVSGARTWPVAAPRSHRPPTHPTLTSLLPPSPS